VLIGTTVVYCYYTDDCFAVSVCMSGCQIVVLHLNESSISSLCDHLLGSLKIKAFEHNDGYIIPRDPCNWGIRYMMVGEICD